MVIRALVRARLLGMQLLTLEASVVVATDDGNWPATSSLILSPHNPTGRDLRSLNPGLAPSGSGTMYARAIELLEQGTDTLERSRRPRLDQRPPGREGNREGYMNIGSSSPPVRWALSPGSSPVL
jgi:hypothetical protein